MSNEKFTPGEWEAETRTLSFNDVFRFGFQVLTGKKRICFCETDNAKNIDEMSANAALISAAPEMYECVYDALSDLEMPDGMRNHFEAILKKARGLSEGEK